MDQEAQIPADLGVDDAEVDPDLGDLVVVDAALSECEIAVRQLIHCGFDQNDCPGWADRDLTQSALLSDCNDTPMLATLVNSYGDDCEAIIDTLSELSSEFVEGCGGGE